MLVCFRHSPARQHDGIVPTRCCRGRQQRSLSLCRCAVLILLLIRGTAVAADRPSATTARVLQSACEIDYPPFCFADQAGRAAGFSVELLQAALQTMACDVHFETGSWNEVKSLLERGDIDVLPLVGRTPEREDLFEFTFPYMTLHGAIVARTDAPGIATLDDLRGRQVAVMKGDNAEEFLRREERGIAIHTTATFDEALRQLSAGRHDAVVIQRLVAVRLLEQMPLANLRILPKPIEDLRQDFCFAVKRDDWPTLALLNEGLALVMADGTFRRLHAKWFAALELPPRRIVVGGDHRYPPYEYLDWQGRPAGYAVELTRAIARQMDLNVEFRLGPWAEIVQGVERGEIDILQGLFYSAERDKRFDFSQTHAMNHYVGVVRQGQGTPPRTLADLAGKRIVVQQGDAVYDYLIENGLEPQLSLVGSQEEVLRELIAGNGDCGIIVRVSALHLMKKHGWDQLLLGQNAFLTLEYCYAVPQGQAALLTEFSEGLRVLRENGEYRQIHEKWLGVYEEQPLRLRTLLRHVAQSVGPLLLLLALAVAWSWSLRREVTRQTRELRHSRESYRDLVENLNEVVYALQLDGRIEFFSPVLREMLGFDPDELVGRSLFELVHAEDLEQVQAKFVKITAGDKVGPFNCRMHNRSGDVRWIRTSARLQRDDGQPIGLTGVMMDVTENLQQTARLQQIHKMESIGQLAGGVAHDFNNLLSVILGYAGLAQAEISQDDPLCEMLAEIKDAGERAARLTQQLLVFSRKHALQPAAFDLNDVVSDIERMLRRILGEDIDLQVRLAPDLPPVLADSGQIEQVIMNLAVNARDAMPTGGQLLIETANVVFAEPLVARNVDLAPGRYVQLTVRDTGTGMDAETQDRLFEPFFSTKTVGKGTGLGLASVYGILQQIGGAIDVASELGRGTTFKVYLPPSPIESSEPADTDHGEQIVRGHGERILVTEDEASLRGLLDHLLTAWGYRVTLAADGEQALATFAEAPDRFDLLLTDVVMPGISGKVLAERVQQLRPDLKVLFMSGYSDKVLVHHGSLDTDIPLIEKPFRWGDLSARLAALLRGPPPARPAQRRFLMIDDEEPIRELVRWGCRKRGHELVGVSRVAEVLDALAAKKAFDVLLVDLNLPGQDPQDLLRQVRAAGHSTPAVIYSGVIDSIPMDAFRELGVVACVEKSADPAPLLEVLEQICADA